MINRSKLVKKIREQARNLLDVVWFRVFLAIAIAYILMLTFSQIEQWNQQVSVCGVQDSSWHCFSKQVLAVIALDNIEGFSILAAATLFLLESRERRRNSIYEAWQVIDNAASANVSTSFARVKALQDLNKYGVSLKGLDVPGAYLSEIYLPNAELNFADLSRTNMTYANLKEANLCDAQLESANLSRASLKETNLTYANLNSAQLEGANLTRANLSYADLSSTDMGNANFKNASLSYANLNGSMLEGAFMIDADLSYSQLEGTDLGDAQLEGASLQHASLLDANLNQANIKDVDFTGVVNLTPEQVKSAKNWRQAKYDQDLQCKLGILF
ncbi:MAG: pentapeptide repeat-containing protein [Cyanobacteria bacterium P01_A01_bin.84]